MGDFRFKFDWDPQKAATNLAKHGVAFAQAVSVFVDPFAATIADDEHSQDEQRWVTLGLSRAGRLMVVIHTYEGDRCWFRSSAHYFRTTRHAFRNERL